jgi:hypothetical protein
VSRRTLEQTKGCNLQLTSSEAAVAVAYIPAYSAPAVNAQRLLLRCSDSLISGQSKQQAG